MSICLQSGIECNSSQTARLGRPLRRNLISVETFNGASHNMPPGVKAEHYVSKADYLVANTIGMGASAPAIRESFAHTIDTTLAAINDLSATQKAAFQRNNANTARDLMALALPDVAPLTGPSQIVSRLQRDLETAARDVASIHSPTPGGDELERDGLKNTPNGPIHSVPVFIDVDAIENNDPAGWIVDQHDLPGMLPSRKGHTVDATHIAGTASPGEKVLVERAIPERAAGGSAMPPARDISTWNGKPVSGTIFEVDKDTYAIHAGKGAFVVIDADRFQGGKTPPNNAYIELAPSGQFRVEPAQHQQQQLGR